LLLFALFEISLFFRWNVPLFNESCRNYPSAIGAPGNVVCALAEVFPIPDFFTDVAPSGPMGADYFSVLLTSLLVDPR